MFADLFRDDVFTLETARLFLRWPKAQDARDIAKLAGDRQVAEMTAGIPHPYSLDFATRFIIDSRVQNAGGQNPGSGQDHLGSGLVLAMALRSHPDQIIGMIEVQHEDGSEALELGYWLGRPFWGQGLMTEAAQALIDAVFLYTQAPSITASIRVMNSASRKVLERCGFQYEGGGMCVRPAWGDSTPSDCYRLTRALWTSLKGWRTPVPCGRELVTQGNAP